jgi:hypothetical protein
MSCSACTTWRGLIPSLCVVGLMAVAVIVAYECGRYHGSPAAMAQAAQERIEWILLTPVAPEFEPAEPDHHGLVVRDPHARARR